MVGDSILDIDIDFEGLGVFDGASSDTKPNKALNKIKNTKSLSPNSAKISSNDVGRNIPAKNAKILAPKSSSNSKIVAPNDGTKNNRNQTNSSLKSKKMTDVFGSTKGGGVIKKFHIKPKKRKTLTTKPNLQNPVSEDVRVIRKRVLPPVSPESPAKDEREPKLHSDNPSNLNKNLSKLQYRNGGSGYSFGQLNHISNLVRQDILDMLYHAGSGHSAGSLDQVEIFVALYFSVMRHDPKDPTWGERDILVQSNGHTVPVRYAVMARAGYFPRHLLLSLRKLGSSLQGHPERMRIPALETTSGPLGSGLSQAAGMALSLMIDGNKTRRIYCTMGDGELNEGNIWEAAMFASKYKLGNLVGIVDRNNIQIDGYTEDVMPLENLKEKWESFGWYVQEVDGNNIESVTSALKLARSQTAKPNLIIAHTIPGKGVDFMEYDPAWHGKSPNKEQEEDAIKRLRTLDGKIKGGHL